MPVATDAIHMTPRLAQVLIYRHAGLSNKDIARRLNIATRTVQAHVAALRRLRWRF